MQQAESGAAFGLPRLDIRVKFMPQFTGSAKGVLTFFCGKMGAGKSTKACEIAQHSNAVLLCEDEWLQSLYPNQIKSLSDYIYYSKQMRPQIKKLVQSILLTGTDVVMDFPANTVPQRNWVKSIFAEIEAFHQLVYIDLPDEVCLAQIRQRCKEQPERVATDTAEMFKQVTKHFVSPAMEEGFVVTLVTRAKL